MKETEFVPNLRFPEFANCKAPVVELRQIAGLVTESVPLSQVGPTSYVSTESLLPEFGGFDRPAGLPTVSAVRAYRRNDMLVSNIRPYLKKVWYADRDGGASNDVLVFRANGKVNPAYLAQIIRNDRFIGHLMKSAKGVKMPRGDAADALSFRVMCPTDEEQRKIAECLESLDELIAAETDKLDALKRHKKGLLQLLFPVEGETTPRLRFPQFRNSEEWRTTSVGAVLEILSGYPFDGTAIVDDPSGVSLLRGVNITEGRIRHSQEIDRFFLGNVLGLERFRVRRGDLVIGMDGSKVGKNSAIVGEADEATLLVQRVARLRSDDPLISRFAFQTIDSERFHKYVDRINTSSGIPHISARQIAEFPLSMPREDELTTVLSTMEEIQSLITTFASRLEVHFALFRRSGWYGHRG